jgi:hypothetical protein
MGELIETLFPGKLWLARSSPEWCLGPEHVYADTECQ